MTSRITHPSSDLSRHFPVQHYKKTLQFWDVQITSRTHPEHVRFLYIQRIHPVILTRSLSLLCLVLLKLNPTSQQFSMSAASHTCQKPLLVFAATNMEEWVDLLKRLADAHCSYHWMQRVTSSSSKNRNKKKKQKTLLSLSVRSESLDFNVWKMQIQKSALNTAFFAKFDVRRIQWTFPPNVLKSRHEFPNRMSGIYDATNGS